jgi:hypothetical protein
VADRYEAALLGLHQVGYREVSIVLDRRRQTIPLEAALASLR